MVIFSDRGGQVSARLLCPRLVVLIALAVGGALIPLTLRVDRRLDEVVAVGLLFFLALSVNGEATRLQDVEGPAETFSAVESAWARLLRDLLGRASWLSSSSGSKYDAVSQTLEDLLTVRRLGKMLSMR